MPSPRSRLRAVVVGNPLAVGEAAILGVGAAATVVAVVLLWAGDLGVSPPEPLGRSVGIAILAAAALLPVAVVVRAAVDLYRALAADVAASSVTILRGLWRAGEVFLVAVVVFFVLSAVLLASTPTGDLPNEDARANLGAMVLMSGVFAVMADGALAVAVAVRLVATAAYRTLGPPRAGADPEPS